MTKFNNMSSVSRVMLGKSFIFGLKSLELFKLLELDKSINSSESSEAEIKLSKSLNSIESSSKIGLLFSNSFLKSSNSFLKIFCRME